MYASLGKEYILFHDGHFLLGTFKVQGKRIVSNVIRIHERRSVSYVFGKFQSTIWANGSQWKIQNI